MATKRKVELQDNVAPLFAAQEQQAVSYAKIWLEDRLAKMEAGRPFFEEVTVTPELASLILERNPNNRRINRSSVKKLADAIRRGEWVMNGETIIISDTGELNDGQHRLSGCVASGMPIKAIIVFGVTRDSRKTVDMGDKRKAGHVLGMSGHKDGNVLAASVRVVLNYERGAHLEAYLTPQQIEEGLSRHPDLPDSNRFGRAVCREFSGSAGGFMALHYLMAKSDREKADRFFTTLATGVGMDTDRHPVKPLRDRLHRNQKGKASLPFIEVAALTIKAWNAFKVGNTIGALRWRTEGDMPEAFPRIM